MRQKSHFHREEKSLYVYKHFNEEISAHFHYSSRFMMLQRIFFHIHKKNLEFLSWRHVLCFVHSFVPTNLLCVVIFFSTLIWLNWNSFTTSHHRRHDEWDFWRSHEDHLRIFEEISFFRKVDSQVESRKCFWKIRCNFSFSMWSFYSVERDLRKMNFKICTLAVK